MNTTSPTPAVTFDVDYPITPRNKLTSAFRVILVLPVLVVLAAFSGLLVIQPLLSIVFRRKYPRWWFDFNEHYLRFSNRVFAYLFLLRDEYPSLDEEQAVHLTMTYPDATQLNRWLPLVKWILAIPHYIVLAVLGVGAVLATLVAWFAILFTGRHPRGLFDYVVGVSRWHNRVIGYAFAMLTDTYPPFSLKG